MAEIRYKAYISYSHSDESWAKWLHRALESYRVPRNLVGSKSVAGEVPARIRPVFRDRDDLSSATDLGSTVKQALADSENLVVICSPASVGSRWVNEEIRQFAGLDRVDRVFCIIVDGQPADDGSVAACFPAALAEIGLQEPLAADARPWADGKQFALLKLIAGLLGLRLDELRQRDLQRRRKRRALFAAGIALAMTLAVITVVSKISEWNEREKAEQLATFVVDLGERLQSDADLETLSLISSEASRHLQDLDPDRLSPETGRKVALALRQMGRVSQSQGKLDQALEPFQRSLELLTNLNNKYPDSPQLLFELGNAEYYVGNLHFRQGRYESAMESWQNYHRATSRLVDLEPDNPDWIMELSYSHNNLAALALESGRAMDDETLFHVAEATRLMKTVVAMRPGDKAVADVYATILAWAATAQNQACNLEEAYVLREKALALAKSSAWADPSNNDLKKRHAYAMTGVARAQIVMGRWDVAEQNLLQAVSMLQQLSLADPSNLHYREETLVRRAMLAKLLADTDQLENVRSKMSGIQLDFESGMEAEGWGVAIQNDYIDSLLAYVGVEARLGSSEIAGENLLTAIELQRSRVVTNPNDIFDLQRLAKTRYQYWLLNGADKIDGLPGISSANRSPEKKFRSCVEADSIARLYVIDSDMTGAAGEVAYLQSKGYADPDFISFCKRHGLCEQ